MKKHKVDDKEVCLKALFIKYKISFVWNFGKIFYVII